MAPPKISAVIFLILRLAEQAVPSIPDEALRPVVLSALYLGQAITVYLVAKGVILAFKK